MYTIETTPIFLNKLRYLHIISAFGFAYLIEADWDPVVRVAVALAFVVDTLEA